MYIVAILEAPTGTLADAGTLARVLGGRTTVLDVRVALAVTPPVVVLRTQSRERADHVADALRGSGVAAAAVDIADVVPVERMVHVRRVSLEDKGVLADARGPMLAYADIAAVVRVAAETSIWRKTRENAAAPGHGRGVPLDVEHTEVERVVEQVLFLFVRQGVPWVLRAGEARYLALGGALLPTSIENFTTVVAHVREHAPRALYDERFVAHPLLRHAASYVRDHDSVAAPLGDAAVEVRVHLLSLALGCGRA